jgi:hypothetical protein
MNDQFLQTLIQVLSTVDSFSVSLILGSVTVLALLCITGSTTSELKEKGLALNVLTFGVLAQIVYRGVDICITGNMLLNKELELTDLSGVYFISLLMLVVAIGLFVIHKYKKIETGMFVFLQAAIWYALFLISQVAGRSTLLQEMGTVTLILVALIVVIVLLLGLDTAKRLYSKKADK